MHLEGLRDGNTPSPPRKPYPTDVSDDEWAFVAPCLSLMTPEAPQRVDDLREVYNASGLHFVAFVTLMLHRLVSFVAQSP